MTRPTTEHREEKAYEKYAWILLFVPAFLTFITPLIVGQYFSASPDPLVIKAVTGMTFDQITAQNPGTALLIGQALRDLGLAEFAFGFMSMAVTAFPFRKGYRFAWYLSWVLPVWLAGSMVNLSYLNAQLGGSFGFGVFSLWAELLFLVILVLGLLLPIRKFFPKKQPVTS
jgi:hypothetical protein